MITLYIRPTGEMELSCDCESKRAFHQICEKCKFRASTKIEEILNSKWIGEKRYITKTI
jgi:hypothetical protein